MAKLTGQEIARVKGQGFLLNRGTENFSGRIVPAGGMLTADELSVIAECARRFGNGKVAMTSRLTVELVGIPFDQIEPAREFVAQAGLSFGGTGAKIRPVTACKGTTCIYGNFDTQALAQEIHNRYYLGWRDVQLPHKFKIAVGGCPNSCMKPALNDFGIEGHRAPLYDIEKCRGCKICQVEQCCPVKAVTLVDSKANIDEAACKTCGVCIGTCPFQAVADTSPVEYQIFVGGTWGKHTRMGTPLSRMVTEAEIFPLLEKTLLWFKDNAFQKERLGAAIDRIGVDQLEKDLFGDDLLARKDEILAAEIKKRP